MKKLLSLVLVLCFLAGLLPVMELKAEALIYADDIVSIAKSLVGQYPYVSGGESPEEGGFDCTGLVYYIYHTRLGMDMTLDQARSKSGLLALGTKISNKADMLPGDVIQMNYGHVMIYIGNNQIIEAAKPGTMIRQQSFSNVSPYFEYAIRFPSVRRNVTANDEDPEEKIVSQLAPPSATVNGSSVSVSWGEVSGYDNFKVFLICNGQTEDSASYSMEVSGDQTMCIFSGIKNGTYCASVFGYYRNGGVISHNESGWGDFVSVHADYESLSALSIRVFGSSVQVDWNGVDDPNVVAYDIYLLNNTSGGTAAFFSTGADARTHVFDNVLDGSYKIWIQSMGEGVIFRQLFSQEFAVQTNLSLTHITINGSIVEVGWNRLSDFRVTEYTVFLQKASGEGISVIQTVNACENRCAFPDVSEGSYVIWLQAVGGSMIYAQCLSEGFSVLPSHTHTLNHTAAIPATCTDEGNDEYWYCADCGKYFADADAQTAISPEETVIAALGHNYENGKCTRCGESDPSYHRGVEYHINSITVRNSDYQPVTGFPHGRAYVEVSVTNLSSESMDTLTLVTYDRDGRMLGMYYLRANPPVDYTFILGVMIDNSAGQVSSVKALMLPSLGEITPLANAMEYK